MINATRIKHICRLPALYVCSKKKPKFTLPLGSALGICRGLCVSCRKEDGQLVAPRRPQAPHQFYFEEAASAIYGSFDRMKNVSAFCCWRLKENSEERPLPAAWQTNAGAASSSGWDCLASTTARLTIEKNMM